MDKIRTALVHNHFCKRCKLLKRKRVFLCLRLLFTLVEDFFKTISEFKRLWQRRLNGVLI
jgi:hypothetical protein